MRIDKFLKVSRIIKRRETAKDLCDDADVFVNGRRAKAALEVNAGDKVVLHLGRHEIEFVINDVRPFAKKDEASTMYTIVRDEIHERETSVSGQ